MSQFPQEWEVEWERVLWKPKPYPDNYVPKSFLASLSKNRESCQNSALYMKTETIIFSREFQATYLHLACARVVDHCPTSRCHLYIPCHICAAKRAYTGSSSTGVDIHHLVHVWILSMANIGLVTK